MKLSIILLLLSSFIIKETQPNITYSTKNGRVSLNFDLTIGKMDAKTNKAHSTMDIKTEAVLFNIKVSTFQFSNPILEQQFKDVYMEVEKYPETTFAGKIRGNVDFKSDKPQKVIVDGVLGMHGITKKRSIPATITFSGDKVKVYSKFKVKASEHKIAIPSGFFTSGKDEIQVVLNIDYTKD